MLIFKEDNITTLIPENNIRCINPLKTGKYRVVLMDEERSCTIYDEFLGYYKDLATLREENPPLQIKNTGIDFSKRLKK